METQRTDAIKIFDYGNSFVICNGQDNNPRFLVDSICTITDRGNTETYYLVKKCKGENTFSKDKLFIENSFDLFPLFGEEETLTFRKFKWYKQNEVGEYKKRYGKGEIWGDRKFLIKEIEGKLLDTTEKIIRATMDGRCLMGRLVVKKGIKAVIDFPIKTINTFKDMWQVDTGFIPFPEFYKYPVYKINSFNMGFISFNSFGICEVITENLVELVAGIPAISVAYYKDVTKITNPEVYIYAV